MIRFEDVQVQFGNTAVLKNLTFSVEQGEKVLIYGKSGIGKTTIFRLLLGFEQVRKGSVYFKNQIIDERAVWTVRRNVAYVSQDLDIGSGTVRSIILNALSYKANKHITCDHSTLSEHLNFLRLPETILDDFYEKLSGGEKQRIAIIIAILLGRNIFLLDEATSSLDSELKERVITYFVGNSSWTVLSISHDRDWLEYPGQRVITMDG